MEKNYLIIDSFEGGIAVCETKDKKYISIDRVLLPARAKEGDAIRSAADGRYELDEQNGRIAKERIARKMDALWK